LASDIAITSRRLAFGFMKYEEKNGRRGMDTTVQLLTHFPPVGETTFQAFHGHRFVEFDPLIPPDESDCIGSTLMKLHGARAGFPEGSRFHAIIAMYGDRPARFLRSLHPRDDFEPGRLETSFCHTAEAAARQIPGDPIRLEADKSLLRPARIGSIRSRHQDVAFPDPAEPCSMRSAINQPQEAPDL
jgi:hypothetical protein